LIEKFLVGDTVQRVTTMRTITTKRSTGSPSALQEHARVRLLRPFDDANLAAGAMGTVEFVYNDGEGYAVEFIEGRSRPVVITVDAADIALAKK
jgi:regulator of RNase E activity RraA